MQRTSPIAVMLHGGAGTLNEENARKKIPGLAMARDAAWTILAQGGPGLDAVEAALRILEDIEYFNAGYGSYPDEEGRIFMDIGVMRGDRTFRSFINVERVRYPSALAIDWLRDKKISLMTVWTPAQMAVLGASSASLKSRYGIAQSHEELFAPFVLEQIRLSRAGETVMRKGTVGCVVRDETGALCAGTSTGGLHRKPDGRVGDSPIIGCGVFADDEIGAISTTGTGESFLSSAITGFVLGEMRSATRDAPTLFAEQPGRLAEILTKEIAELTRKCGAPDGGAMIVLPRVGIPHSISNSEMLSLGYRYRDYTGTLQEDACIACGSGQVLR